MNIRVTNLSLNTIDADIRKLFSQYGQVNAADIIRDKNNGRPTGAAMIDMVKDEEGRLAVENLNQTLIHGRSITVIEVSDSL
jgi:RNA recognition motif-containing protein